MSMLPLSEINYKINYSEITPDIIKPLIEYQLQEAEKILNTIITFSGERTFENTLLEYERITEKLGFSYGVLSHIESVATYPEYRTVFNEIETPVIQFFSKIPLSSGLWSAILEYSNTDEAKNLTGIKKRFLELTIADFKRNGADLSNDIKERLSEIDTELSQLTTKFAQNVIDSTNSYELIIEDIHLLKGLPPHALDQAKSSAELKGKPGWRFTLQASSVIPLLTYLENSEIREKIYRAYHSRGAHEPYDNKPLIPKILELRAEKAKILKFKNFADLVLEDRMAKNGETAQEFHKKLKEKLIKKAKQEQIELEKFKQELEGKDSKPLKSWDIAFYAEKLRKSRYNFDPELLRPYFQYEKVLNGLFNLVNKLYGISIKEVNDFPVWHKDVVTYEMIDKDNTVLGIFHTDFFPRESKRSGAWMNYFITGKEVNNTFTPHLGLIAGNFTPPLNGTPSLLTHEEVKTLFHEFGHLLHQLFGKVSIKSLNGALVAWDFVELPSQIMENWCWQKETLNLFAKHYKTAAKMPEELFQNMTQAKNFRVANFYLRQIGLGEIDLKLHIDYNPLNDGTPIQYARKIMQDCTPFPFEDDYSIVANFTHIFSSPVGYAAGYYSYLWAKILDTDAFLKFKTEGIFDQFTAESFRECILSKGNSEEPMSLFTRFMGREPDGDALLRDIS